ncbi:MAG: hypothetical protein MPN21_19030 [Thermoanaerobaculia bacterium]|nr:hypothetical protein [Thermoanaerobaculia bacterium]
MFDLLTEVCTLDAEVRERALATCDDTAVVRAAEAHAGNRSASCYGGTADR